MNCKLFGQPWFHGGGDYSYGVAHIIRENQSPFADYGTRVVIHIIKLLHGPLNLKYSKYLRVSSVNQLALLLSSIYINK